MSDIIEVYLDIARKAALLAGEAILEIYYGNETGIELKKDNSPLTVADRAAHSIIKKQLEVTLFPVLSEEDSEVSYEARVEWDFFWMVDPLDGTKEFIGRNGEFTVNIALIHKTESVLGVVYYPIMQKMFWGIKGKGSYKAEKNGPSMLLRINKKVDQTDGTRVLCSRHHLDEKTFEFIQRLKNPQFISMGSSLKFMAIAEGEADIYPRFAPTMEWDTAAAQIILEEAGGIVLDAENNEKIRYNKPSLLNPFFIARY
jgi:3'(2'), 5'-bisphosphate nucleotidase